MGTVTRFAITALLFIVFTQQYQPARAQAEQGKLHADSLLQLPDKFFAIAEKKCVLVSRLLQRKAAKALKKMQRQEEKLYRALLKKDEEAASAVFSSAVDSLQKMQHNLGSKMGAAGTAAVYQPWTDSIATTLSFLQGGKGVRLPEGTLKQLPALSNKLQQLQSRMAATAQLQAYIRSRQQLIQQQVARFGSMKKHFARYTKQFYYYKAQAAEYKSLLSNRKKAEAAAMEALHKIPAFKAFMDRNSYIGRLLTPPAADAAGYGQTNEYVAGLIRSSAGGPQAMQQIRANVDAAKNELEQLKSKLKGGSSTGDDIPSFKPNDMKQQRFLSRISLSTSCQFTPARGTQPQVLDAGLQAAYKFSQNIQAGIGGGYRLGLGRGLQRLALSHEGVSLRSFAEARLRGQLFASAGFEYHYNARFYSLRGLQQPGRWSRAVLAGISKKFSGGRRGGSISVLYDFLAASRQPVKNPLVIRYGWNIK